MARKVDAQADQVSKRILEQLNTFTVGFPLDGTGLTGDQIPENIFDVDDLAKIKDQMTLQLSNLDAFECLDLLGRMTNTASSSGPLRDTAFIHVTLDPSSTVQDGFIPPVGTVWQWMGGGASLQSASGTVKSYTSMYTPASGINHDGSAASFVIVEDSDSSDYTAISYTVPDAPIYVTSNNYLRIQVNGTYTSSGSSVKMAYIRVR